VEAAELLHAAALTQESREVELAEAAGLHASAAYALARAGRLEDAALMLERGRAQGLSGLVEREQVDLAGLQAACPDLARRYQQALKLLARLDTVELGQDELAVSRPSLSAEAVSHYAMRAARELAAVVAEIRSLEAHHDFLKPQSLTQLAKPLEENEAAVLFGVTEVGSLGLIVQRNDTGGSDVEAIWSELTSRQLEALLVGNEGTPSFVAGQLGDVSALRRSLPGVLGALGALAGALAIQARTAGADRLVLVPGGLLALVPLHGAEYIADGARRHLFQAFEVTYAPSLRVLAAARAALAERQEQEPYLAGAANPLPSDEPLTFATAELEHVAEFFDDDRRESLYEERADELALLLAASRASHVHLACHGLFDPVDPLNSYLALANDERLTLAEVMYRPHFREVRLVVMSACQTALTEFRRLPDEAIGLPAGFLRAGVAGVIGALWPVDDFSTAVLMTCFYRFHLVGDRSTGEGPMSPARALQRAQLAVAELDHEQVKALVEDSEPLRRARESAGGELGLSPAVGEESPRTTDTPFGDPYHWAGFTLTGS